MTPETLDFSGNAITFLGLVGLISTLVILVTSFRRFYNSPLNQVKGETK
jgi:flagellar biosynthesis protein FliP